MTKASRSLLFKSISFFLLLLVYFASVAVPVSGQTLADNPLPRLLTPSKFKLPQEAIDAGIDGTIMVATKINEKGKVTAAESYAGPEWPCATNPAKEIELVKKLAEEEVKGYSFEPAVKNGKPIDSNVGLTFWVGRAFKDLEGKREAELSKGAPKPITVDGGVVNGKAISLPPPTYPAGLRGSGSVTVSVLIGEDGTVIKAGARNGPVLFQGRAREAACNAKFAPTTVRGNPVKVSGVITYNFIVSRQR